MAIFTNPFIDVVNSFNGLPNKPINSHLSTEMQKRKQQRSVAMYLTMRHILDEVQQLLQPDEKIINLLPMTNEENSQMATGGIMGMYAPQTEETKQYIHDQTSLRGNRLMVFTNQRIIFFIVIEFLDNPKQYFSYNYDQLQAVKLAERKISVPGNDHFWKRDYYTYYSLDFETDDKHVFTEFLTKENGQLFKKNLLTIPAMAHVQITDHVVRPNKFDYVFSNTDLASKILFLGIPIFIGLTMLLGFLGDVFHW